MEHTFTLQIIEYYDTNNLLNYSSKRGMIDTIDLIPIDPNARKYVNSKSIHTNYYDSSIHK